MFDFQANAWWASPGVILGRKMRHMTVGHLFVLEALESPYVSGSVPAFDDAVMGVLVCSMPFRDAIKYLNQPLNLKKLAEKWGTAAGKEMKQIEDVMKMFHYYVETYFAMPEEWIDPEKKSKPSCVPFASRLAWMLMERVSEEEAWEMPLTRAIMYYTIEAERNGVEFVTQTQKQQIEAIQNGNR